MNLHTPNHKRAATAACVAAALLAPWSLVRASRSIDEHRAADPQGEVEIVNVAGTVEVEGWERNEIQVSGSAGDNVDRVDVSSSGNHTSIHTVLRSGHSWGSDGEARLVVHVPTRSAITASLVSADFKIAGVQGELKLQTISGEVKGELGADAHASSVSGDIRLTALSAKTVELKTISGEVHFKGGGGDVEVTTVSGDLVLELGGVTRGRFKSVSGDVTVGLDLQPSGQIESESVSGDVTFNFAALPDAQFDVQTLSGDIKNCFGPKPTRPAYAPGSRLQFASGGGSGRVRISSKSGDVKFCAPGGHRDAARSGPTVHKTRFAMVVPYVF